MYLRYSRNQTDILC